MQLVTFALNGIDFGIPIKDVESIETRKNIFKVPDSPPHIRGILKLHGEIIPVYNLASRFAYGDIAVGNIVVVNVSGMKIGLEVEQVKSILEVENRNVIPMPQIMNATQHCFNDVVSNQKELIVLLDAEKLVTQAERESLSKLVEQSAEL